MCSLTFPQCVPYKLFHPSIHQERDILRWIVLSNTALMRKRAFVFSKHVVPDILILCSNYMDLFRLYSVHGQGLLASSVAIFQTRPDKSLLCRKDSDNNCDAWQTAFCQVWHNLAYAAVCILNISAAITVTPPTVVRHLLARWLHWQSVIWPV